MPAPRLPSGEVYAPPADPLTVLHEDADLIAVDKPSGLLSVPGKAPGLDDCLEARLRRMYPEALQLHRLDMDTSGVMLFARTREAQRHIARQFNAGRIEKIYEALVWGRPEADTGRIDAPLIADWPRRPLQKICHDTGRPSVTTWAVLASEGPLTRMMLMPKTGRSHQLRVHMCHLGHAIAGDRFYATGTALSAFPRLALHAKAISIRHPQGGAQARFVSAVPF